MVRCPVSQFTVEDALFRCLRASAIRVVVGGCVSITIGFSEPNGSRGIVMGGRVHAAYLFTLLMLLTPLSTIPLSQPTSATPADSGSASPIEVMRVATGSLSEPSIAADSNGNFHLIWVENQSKLMYMSIDSEGLVTNGPAQYPSGSNVKWSPRIAIDNSGIIHVVWIQATTSDDCLVYLAAQPSSDADPTDGLFSPTVYSTNNIVCKSNQLIENMANPEVAVDSQGAAHIVWQDRDDPIGSRFSLPGIRYTMMVANFTSFIPNSPIFDTLVTTGVSSATHPDVTITDDDKVAITWQDTRGSMVEMVVILDSSGNMANEWGDTCTLMYGGGDGEGWNSPSLKQMADAAQITLLETLYGLGDYIRPEANNGNCNGHNTNQRSRSVMLTAQDDSGGIRKLHRTIYNGQAQNWGTQWEDWGPGTTWACLSWMDSLGNTGNQANPPTQYDHRWNPDATKMVIPLGDEGPKGGDPAQQSDDTQSIGEAHDACVDGGIIPQPLLGEVQSNNLVEMQSHALDLSQCSAGSITTATRTCSAFNSGTTNAGGLTSEWPGNGVTLEEMFGHWMELLHSGSPEVWVTVLDPYAKLTDVNFQEGTSAHTESGGAYGEDIGWGGSVDSHFVVVNDTRVTDDYSWSARPSLEIASDGEYHFVWSDSRDGRGQSDSHELVWKRINLNAWDFNGQSNGIDLSSNIGASSSEHYLSPLDASGGVGARDASAHNGEVAFTIDDDDMMHAAWVEGDSGDLTNLSYRRSRDATLVTPSIPNSWMVACGGGGACDGPTYDLSPWQSYKMGVGGDQVLTDVRDDGPQPAIAVTADGRRTSAVAWIDSEPCNSGDTNLPMGDHLCFRRIQRSLLQIDSDSPSLARTFEPGEIIDFDFTVSHLGSTTNSVMSVNLEWSGLPPLWDVSAVVGNGSGATLMTPIDSSWDINEGSVTPLTLTITAPSKVEATTTEHHIPRFGIVSSDGEHGASLELDLTLDVRHGLVLSAPQHSVTIEQGGSGILSVNISNYGNLWEEVTFPSTTSSDGRTIWGLPYGWDVDFTDRLELLADGSTSSKTMTITIPDSQAPGTVNLTVVASSAKASNPELVDGAQAALELTVNIARKRAGNVVFDLWDSSEEVMPGECVDFAVDISKHYGDDDVVISVVKAPSDRPDSVSPAVWEAEHWTYEVDYSQLPGGNEVPSQSGRWFTDGMRRTITVTLCAPTEASAGVVEQIELRAELDADPLANDMVTMQASVMPLFRLDAEWQSAPYAVEPGQSFEASLYVTNSGNVPLSFTPWIPMDGWTAEWVDGTPNGLVVGEEMFMTALIDVPLDALAGETFVPIYLESIVDSEGSLAYAEGTIEVLPRIDFQLSLDDYSHSDVSIRPGDIIDVPFTVKNAGNLAEPIWLENFSTGESGTLSATPRLDGLPGVEVQWYVVENAGTPLAVFTEVTLDAEHRLRLPELLPGEEVPVVCRITMYSHPGWTRDFFAVRLRGMSGFAVDGGDIDADEFWLGEDNNEETIYLTAFAPDLMVNSVEESVADQSVKLSITVQNHGNDPAENILLRVCSLSLSDAVEVGCTRADALVEQRITYIASADGGQPKSHVVTLKFSEAADTVVVMVDAEREVIESDESNNMVERSLAFQPGEPSGSDAILEMATDNVLLVLMGVLWLVIASLGLSAMRGRGRARRQMPPEWQMDASWGVDVIRDQRKSRRKGRKKGVQEQVFAEVHSMDYSMGSPSSIDVSDLQIGPDDATPSSAPSGALEPLGDIGYDPSEEKVKDDEFTIGDLIGDLL